MGHQILNIFNLNLIFVEISKKDKICLISFFIFKKNNIKSFLFLYVQTLKFNKSFTYFYRYTQYQWDGYQSAVNMKQTDNGIFSIVYRVVLHAIFNTGNWFYSYKPSFNVVLFA